MDNQGGEGGVISAIMGYSIQYAYTPYGCHGLSVPGGDPNWHCPGGTVSYFVVSRGVNPTVLGGKLIAPKLS